jgi:hypothetical protein
MPTILRDHRCTKPVKRDVLWISAGSLYQLLLQEFTDLQAVMLSLSHCVVRTRLISSIREATADRISLLIAAVPFLIAGLQDADKIGHAGSIPVFGDNRNLSIGPGLAPVPNPQEEIGDVFHGVLSAVNCGSGR